MNMEDNFNAADVYLKMAKEKVDRHDLEGALVMLSKAYSPTRELIDHVFKLHAMKTEVEHPSGG